MNVAVIGAGAAGLVAAKELLAEGHQVTVYEQAHQVGGVWLLDDNVEDDPLGQCAERSQVHSSMYNNLRVNLPRQLMGFSALPFVPAFMQGKSQDSRMFPGHREVLLYLEAFAERFGLLEHVRFNTRVARVRPAPCGGAPSSPGSSPLAPDAASGGAASQARGCGEGGLRAGALGGMRWEVTSTPARSSGDRAGAGQAADSSDIRQVDDAADSTETYVFDAVVVCNGHYAVPRLPPVPGIDAFPRRLEHSHNYRQPEQYEGQKVLVVGAHASGEDIARDVAASARQVVMSAQTWMKPEWASDLTPFGAQRNITRRPWPAELRPDGSVVFVDGSAVHDFDVVMFCTGYHYSFPFLEDGIVDASRSHVRPLYQHMFCPRFGASLSFIGITFKIVPFPQFELQTRLVARVLSGRSALPTTREMNAWMDDHHRQLAEAQVLDRHVHMQGDAQWAYNDWLAERCGPDVPRTPAWRIQLWRDARAVKRDYSPDVYRDRWDNEESVAHAHAEFSKQAEGGGRLQSLAPVGEAAVAV